MKDDGSLHHARFGPYEADFHTQELWNDGTRLKLAGQPFEILEMLVARRGELVSREDLQRRLWPEDHFVDASHGLNAAVNKLRETLNDSADQPRYIETLPRRGYRFIGRVESDVPAIRVAEEVLDSTVLEPSPVHPVLATRTAADHVNPTRGLPPPRHLPVLFTASIALVVGSVIGIVLTNGLRSRDSESSAQEAVVKTEPKISSAEPEVKERRGRDLVASGPSEIKVAAADSLWQREAHAVLRTAEFRTIIPSSDGGNAGPQFSPDGKRIAFMSNRTGPWQVWVSNADGSDPVQLSRTDSAGTPRWSPDGQSLAFDAPLDGGTYVFVAPVNDPERARPLAEGCVPSFSRDGKFIYFASDRTGDWQVWKVSLTGEREIQVSRQGGFAALESPDGNVYYSKSNAQDPEIWKVPIAGGAELPLWPAVRPRTWSSWTVTKDGLLLVVDLPDGRSHLNFYNPATRTVRDLASLQTAPRWMGATSDGKKVVMNDAAERQITMVDNLR